MMIKKTIRYVGRNVMWLMGTLVLSLVAIPLLCMIWTFNGADWLWGDT